MSWSYSPGLVVEFLEASCSDTEPSALSNTTPMPDQFYWPDKPTEHSRISRFGMTCEPLTGNLGEELLMWFQAGFRAKTLAAPGQTTIETDELPDSMERKADSGMKWPGSFAKWNQGEFLWKTAQTCLFMGLIEFYGTWPRWGLMRDGECYQQPQLVPLTNANACGYWLPTPTAHNAKEGNYPAESTRNSPTLASILGGKIHPEFTELMMGWPIGHTDLKPSETGKSRNAEPQLGACLEGHE